MPRGGDDKRSTPRARLSAGPRRLCVQPSTEFRVGILYFFSLPPPPRRFRRRSFYPLRHGPLFDRRRRATGDTAVLLLYLCTAKNSHLDDDDNMIGRNFSAKPSDPWAGGVRRRLGEKKNTSSGK